MYDFGAEILPFALTGIVCARNHSCILGFQENSQLIHGHVRAGKRVRFTITSGLNLVVACPA